MNQRVLITGASHGIGKAAAERFAKEGCTLILNCRQSVEELSALEFYLKKNYSVDCISLIGDVSSPDFVKEMFEKTMERFGGIDILINNAGISHIGLLGDMSNEEWHRVMGINLDSVFYCCREAIPYMLSKKSGSIVNVSSVWGNIGASMEVAYSASKGAVNSFTKALAKELAPSNIRVNAAAFGTIDTRMNSCFTGWWIPSSAWESAAWLAVFTHTGRSATMCCSWRSWMMSCAVRTGRSANLTRQH